MLIKITDLATGQVIEREMTPEEEAQRLAESQSAIEQASLAALRSIGLANTVEMLDARDAELLAQLNASIDVLDADVQVAFRSLISFITKD